jgi:hypothetical protein
MDGLPFCARVGHTGLGIGIGCGLGVGVGSPISLAGVPVAGSMVSGLQLGVGQLLNSLPPPLRAVLQPRLPRGVSAGAGCGLGVGYGFGAGLFLKPSAQEKLAAQAARLSAAFSERLKAVAPPTSTAPGPARTLAAPANGVAERLDALAEQLRGLAEEQALLREALCESLPAEGRPAACERQQRAPTPPPPPR